MFVPRCGSQSRLSVIQHDGVTQSVPVTLLTGQHTPALLDVARHLTSAKVTCDNANWQQRTSLEFFFFSHSGPQGDSAPMQVANRHQNEALTKVYGQRKRYQQGGFFSYWNCLIYNFKDEIMLII